MTTTGILGNLSTTLRGVDYKGRDALIKYSQTFNNHVAECVIPGGEIFDTRWLNQDVFNGLVNLNLMFDCDVTSPVDVVLELKVYRRDLDDSNDAGSQIGNTINIYYLPDDVFNYYGVDFQAFFSGKYEYRITLNLFEGFSGTYTDLYYVKIVNQTNTSVLSSDDVLFYGTDNNYPVRAVLSGTAIVPLDLGVGEQSVDISGGDFTCIIGQVLFGAVCEYGSFIPYRKGDFIKDANGYITGFTIGVDDSYGNSGDSAVVDWMFVGVRHVPIY